MPAATPDILGRYAIFAGRSRCRATAPRRPVLGAMPTSQKITGKRRQTQNHRPDDEATPSQARRALSHKYSNAKGEKTERNVEQPCLDHTQAGSAIVPARPGKRSTVHSKQAEGYRREAEHKTNELNAGGYPSLRPIHVWISTCCYQVQRWYAVRPGSRCHGPPAPSPCAEEAGPRSRCPTIISMPF